jgi:Asp-tRNA(Asn)/Glu-tRNA(Gln) amidotransferase A subunit family amidase
MPHEGIADFQARRLHGEASAQDLVESSLRDIEALNPRLDAFVCVETQSARADVCFMTGGQVADWFAAQER